MKAVELRIHLPFSYWLQEDPETHVSLARPLPRAVAEYLRLLASEISGMKEDFEDVTVSSIAFRGGSISSMDTGDLERLLILLHRTFRIEKNCPITGVLFPGELDMENISFFRNHKISPLLFEIPSLSFRECEKTGFPVALQALDKTVYFLQNFNESEWGLRLPIGIPGREEAYWEYIQGQLYHYLPGYLQFFSLNPEMPENPGYEKMLRHLCEHGYHQITQSLLSLRESVPPILNPLPGQEVVGIGLGAKGFIDGFCIENTTSWDRYRAKASCYRDIIARVYSPPSWQNNNELKECAIQ